MLDGRAAALMSLHTARHGGGHLAGDERVLRVVLKVAPAADRTMDVQRRGKPQMHAEVLHLLADDVTAPLHKIRVKALRQRGADGNGRAVLGLDLAAGLRLAVALVAPVAVASGSLAPALQGVYRQRAKLVSVRVARLEYTSYELILFTYDTI